MFFAVSMSIFNDLSFFLFCHCNKSINNSSINLTAIYDKWTNQQTNKQTINYAMLSNTLIAGRLKIGGHRSEMLEYCFFSLSLSVTGRD